MIKASMVKKGISISVLLVTMFLFCSTLSNISAEPNTTTEESIKGIMVDAVGNTLTDRAQIESMLKKIKGNDFNTAFIQIRKGGEAYYSSLTEPLAFPLASSGYGDPLIDVIEVNKAAEPKLKIFAWFETLRIQSGYQEPLPGNIMLEHPEWICLDNQLNQYTQNGDVYIDIGIPEARDYIVGVIMEVVRKYNLDGVYLNGLYYPEDNLKWGYNKRAVEQFNRENKRTGAPDIEDPVWIQWRRSNLTKLVEQIHKAIKEVKPDMKIAIGCLAEGTPPATDLDFQDSVVYKGYLQDWMLWNEKGYFDYNLLLDLRNYAKPDEAMQFKKWASFAAAYKSNAQLIVGIAGYMNFADGTLNELRCLKSENITNNIALFNYNKVAIGNENDLYLILKRTFFAKNGRISILSGLPKYEPPAPIGNATAEEKITTATLSKDTNTTGTKNKTASKDQQTTSTLKKEGTPANQNPLLEKKSPIKSENLDNNQKLLELAKLDVTTSGLTKRAEDKLSANSDPKDISTFSPVDLPPPTVLPPPSIDLLDATSLPVINSPPPDITADVGGDVGGEVKEVKKQKRKKVVPVVTESLKPTSEFQTSASIPQDMINTIKDINEKKYLSSFSKWNTIVLKNKNTFKGRVEREEADKTVILLENGVEFKVNTSDIASVKGAEN